MASSDRRGDHSTATRRDSYTEMNERKRRGGGAYDAGPGRTSMPTRNDLDGPREPCGAFNRVGSSRGNRDSASRGIQDADKRGRY